MPAFARRDQTLVAAKRLTDGRGRGHARAAPVGAKDVFAVAALLFLLVGAATAEWLMRSPSGSVVGTRGGGHEAPDVPRLIVHSFEDLSGN